MSFYLRTGKPTADIQNFVKGSHNYASIRPEHFLGLKMPVPSLIDQLHIIELQKKILELEKVYKSTNEALNLLPQSIYEIFFENTHSESLDCINKTKTDSEGLLSFDYRYQ